MNVLITGCDGQLGYELQRTAPAQAKIIATDYQHLDITNEDAVDAYFSEHKPRVVINAAAYTAVDKAEQEAGLADKVNHIGAKILAQNCAKHDANLIQVSTDFIFDGKNFKPYLPDDTPNPVSVYGKTKLDGELAAQKACTNTTIIRTAWVYSAHGNNFVKTMLKLMNERNELGIIADQIGTPTWANGLAQCCWAIATAETAGQHTYHWTDAGVASWYDFAEAIYKYGKRFGLIKNDVTIKPITTEDYPTPAARPHYSVLDKTSAWQATELRAHHWEYQLRQMLKELIDG